MAAATETNVRSAMDSAPIRKITGAKEMLEGIALGFHVGATRFICDCFSFGYMMDGVSEPLAHAELWVECNCRHAGWFSFWWVYRQTHEVYQ